jgi:hypothetical protein
VVPIDSNGIGFSCPTRISHCSITRAGRYVNLDFSRISEGIRGKWPFLGDGAVFSGGFAGAIRDQASRARHRLMRAAGST